MDPKFAKHSDADLMRAARRSSEAYAELYRRHAGSIYQWALNQTGDPHVATDLIAETFAIGWEQRTTFVQEDTDSARPWLFGIAHNVLRMWARSRATEARAARRLGMQVRTDEWLTDLTESSSNELATEPHLLFGLLGENDRTAVTLRVVDGLSYRDIAERLSCSPTAARMRVMRGLKTMRRIRTATGDNS